MGKFLLGAVSLILAFLLTGCGFGGRQAAGNDVVLRVGTEPNFPPFEFSSERYKEYQGFDMDLIRAVGREMGCRIEIVPMNFADLVPALQAKKIDTIISGMTINEQRREQVLFSEPYYKSGLTIAVRYDNNYINDYADLRGKRVAVEKGTTAQSALEKLGGAEVRVFDSLPDCFMELSIGGVEAVVGDRPVQEYYIHNYGMAGAKILGALIAAEDYGIAVGKDRSDLQGNINDALKRLQETGEFQQISAKWFGK